MFMHGSKCNTLSSVHYITIHKCLCFIYHSRGNWNVKGLIIGFMILLEILLYKDKSE